MELTQVKAKFPLHLFVWGNEYRDLDEFLKNDKHDIETVDPRGRTPLMLAVTLDHLESARVLLRHGASACAVNPQRWSVSQEAVSTGDPELVKLLLTYRDGQREDTQAKSVVELLKSLDAVQDFYVEMGWEFTSWVPMVARMCPSDVCRVWKRGSCLRIDTSLVGMADNNSWIKGNLSYVFRITPHGAVSEEIHHGQSLVYRHEMRLSPIPSLYTHNVPSEDFVARKLTQPVFATYIDVDKIEIEKSKSGILGWRSDRKETVSGHECQVYSANNVQVVTLRRTEHMTEEDKAKMRQANSGVGGFSLAASALTNLLQGVEHPLEEGTETEVPHGGSAFNPSQITPEEYFDSNVDLEAREIGRPKEVTARIKTLKAHMWMCRDYPLTLKGQLLPVIDLMAQYNPHFHKLKEFINMSLPQGFPVKIEIPLYHVLNARITFSNLYASEKPVSGVTFVPSTTAGRVNAVSTSSSGSSNSLLDSCDPASVSTIASTVAQCIIDDSVFAPPSGYFVRSDSPVHVGGIDEEEQMLELALQHSLLEYDGPDNPGAAPPIVRNNPPLVPRRRLSPRRLDAPLDEDEMLQRAIAASLGRGEEFTLVELLGSPDTADEPVAEDDMKLVLEMSKREVDEEQERQKREEEEFQRVLELSKLEM